MSELSKKFNALQRYSFLLDERQPAVIKTPDAYGSWLDSVDVAEFVEQQAARIKELDKRNGDLILENIKHQDHAANLLCEREALKAENERLKELMSGLVHWNNQGHIDQSFWDAAAQLTDPTMG